MTAPAPRHPRRRFLTRSWATASALATLDIARAAHAAGSDVLRVGLVGCGGRGRGAALNALNADPHARLVALADLYPQQIQRAIDNLKPVKGAQVAVDDDHRFVGFEAYRQLLASGVDVVLLALPTYFHPIYLQACIEAGKHVFCEKIHAVDAPGVRTVLAVTEEARRKGLSVVSGLAWRYDTGVRETMRRVHDGAIGRITALQEICNTGSLRSLPRRPGMTEMEYQIFDWYDFTWISADLPGLNLVHNLDKGAWAMHDEPPLKAWGMGGRQTRTGPTFGDVYDHHATVFEYADGTRMYAYCRQQNGCLTDISDTFYGTKGRCSLLRNRIEGQTNWRYAGPPCNRFDLEHVALFSSIRSGKPINNGLYMARSSLLALMCTWCSHTGREITWEQALNSNYRVAPPRVTFDVEPPVRPGPDGQYPIAMPGVTRLLF
jgi:predicted dehydrogenase